MEFLSAHPLMLTLILFAAGLLLGLALRGGGGAELKDLRRARDEWEQDRLALLSSFGGFDERHSERDPAPDVASGLDPDAPSAEKLDALQAELAALAAEVDRAAEDDARIEALLDEADRALGRRRKAAAEVEKADAEAAKSDAGTVGASTDHAAPDAASTEAETGDVAAGEDGPDSSDAAPAQSPRRPLWRARRIMAQRSGPAGAGRSGKE